MDRWIPQKKNWIEKFSRAESNEPEQKRQEYGITIYSLKCTKDGCGSFEIHLYKTMPWAGNKRDRYYLCKDCGHRFRVTEIKA